MLKKIAIFTLCCSFPMFNAQAQENGFYQNLLISNEIKEQEAEQKTRQEIQQQMEKAQDRARSLLSTKPQNIKIDAPQIKRRSLSTVSDSETSDYQNLEAAPFGLSWQANETDIKNMGVVLTPTQQEDYVNSFIATQLPKEAKGFRIVQLSFGEENKLWRIIAYGDFIDDEADASQGLKLYKMYARLLNQKYGKQQEFYTPAVTTVEKEVIIQGRPTKQSEQVEEKIGNPNFLSQLQQGTASLYSTFEGNGIGAALALNVDGEGKSYIIIDYKYLKTLQQREQETLDIL